MNRLRSCAIFRHFWAVRAVVITRKKSTQAYFREHVGVTVKYPPSSGFPLANPGICTVPWLSSVAMATTFFANALSPFPQTGLLPTTVGSLLLKFHLHPTHSTIYTKYFESNKVSFCLHGIFNGDGDAKRHKRQDYEALRERDAEAKRRRRSTGHSCFYIQNPWEVVVCARTFLWRSPACASQWPYTWASLGVATARCNTCCLPRWVLGHALIN